MEQKINKEGLGIGLIVKLIGAPVIFLVALILFILPMPFIFLAGDSIMNSPVYDNSSYYSDSLIITAGKFHWPLNGYTKISSGYGSRVHPIEKVRKMHTGIDIPAPLGTNIFAVADGIVEFSGSRGGYGNLIIIRHSSSEKSYYAHNQRNIVSQGDTVKQGQIIGTVGSTGKSTGPHLHLEVRINNNPVDPLRYYTVTRDIPTVLPEELKYKAINEKRLLQWLEHKNSYLASTEFISEFVSAAKEFDIDPLLLVAITGQEQSFVPKDHRNAADIAKNPFNVFGSWQRYGKSFHDSARVASRTIVNLSKDRPPSENPIRWLSSKANPRGYYAADGNWWIGVSKIYDQIRKEVGYAATAYD